MEAYWITVGIVGTVATALMVVVMVYLTLAAMRDEHHGPNGPPEEAA